MDESLRPLPFALELGGGAGRLSARDVHLTPHLCLTSLRLRLPQLRMPPSLGGGAEAFRHHRARLQRLEIVVSVAWLAEVLATRAQQAAPKGGHLGDVRLRVEGADFLVTARARVEGYEADCLWRGGLVAAGERGVDALLLSIHTARVTGWLPRSGWELGAELLALLPDRFVRQRSLSTALLAPLRPALEEILVARGWKLPQHGDASLASLALDDGLLRVQFRSGSEEEEEATPALPEDEPSRGWERFVRDLEQKRSFARVDALVADGATEPALREIERLCEAGDGSPLLDERWMALLAARPETVGRARERAESRLARDPRDREALLTMLAAREADGDSGGAVEVLRRLADTWEPSSEPRELAHTLLRLARALADAGQHAQAAAALERLLNHDGEDAEALESLALLRARLGDAEGAAACWSRILAVMATPEAQRRAARALAWHHVRTGHALSARALLALLAAQGAESEEGLRLEAATCTLERRWEAAAEALRRLLERSLAAGDGEAADEAASELARVLDESLGRADEAALALSLVDERFGEAPARLASLARLIRSAGDSHRARRLEERALALLESGPQGPASESAALRAELHDRLAFDLRSEPAARALARSHFERALDARPADREALEGLESLVESAEHWDELAARLHAALEAAQDEELAAELALRLALIYARTFDFPDQAVPLLERCLELRPRDRFALRHLVELTRRVGAWDYHRAALERMLGVASGRKERVATLLALAEVEADRLGRLDSAQGRLESLLRESPRDAEALSRLAHVLRARGEHEALAGVLRRQAALAAEPERRRSLLLELAELQLDSLGRRDEAEASLREAEAIFGGREDPRQRALSWRLRVEGAGGAPRVTPVPRGATQEGPVEISEDERRALHGELREIQHIERRGAGVGWRSESAGERWFRALQLADTGDLPGAVEVLRAALGDQPDHQASRELLALLLAAPPVAAVEDASAASAPEERVSADPQRAEALTAEARAALEKGDAQGARSLAQAALAADPHAVDALDLLLSLPGAPAQRAEWLARRAELAWSAQEAARFAREAAEALDAVGEHQRAEHFLRRYLRWVPHDDEVAFDLAERLRAGGRWAELRTLLEERVEALDRLRAEGGDEAMGVAVSLVRTELAAFHLEQRGDKVAAAALLQRARRDWPRNDEALERLAALLEEQQDWLALADVLEAFVGLIEDRPVRIGRLKQLVELYRGPLADPVAARETLRVALREMPEKEAARLRALLE